MGNYKKRKKIRVGRSTVINWHGVEEVLLHRRCVTAPLKAAHESILQVATELEHEHAGLSAAGHVMRRDAPYDQTETVTNDYKTTKKMCKYMNYCDFFSSNILV